MNENPKYPETADIARKAFAGSGAKTYRDFVDIYCCGMRTFQAWLAGEKEPNGIARMVLREAAKGWRPQ